tara:strand:+ start:4495 stop:4653 length:159 start_codon:yes stop_codon:yes gene_type:complete
LVFQGGDRLILTINWFGFIEAPINYVPTKNPFRGDIFVAGGVSYRIREVGDN